MNLILPKCSGTGLFASPRPVHKRSSIRAHTFHEKLLRLGFDAPADHQCRTDCFRLSIEFSAPPGSQVSLWLCALSLQA